MRHMDRDGLDGGADATAVNDGGGDAERDGEPGQRGRSDAVAAGGGDCASRAERVTWWRREGASPCHRSLWI